MKPLPPCHGIIPARYGSTRFPAKALADINGKPMFWHVWNRAASCGNLLSVTLATDDDRIAAPAKALGVPCVLTSPEHQSGTDRVYEAASLLNLPEESVIVNIQGDEPLLDPQMLVELTEPFSDPAVRVSTLARRISPAEAASPDQVKVVVNANKDALYFSRSPIPYDRERQIPAEPEQAGQIDGNIDERMTARTNGAKQGESPSGADVCGCAGYAGYLGHVGLYAFRYEALRAFTSLAPSHLENLEKLEQLRLLENGIPIRVALTNRQSVGVDRPEDLEQVLALLGKK